MALRFALKPVHIKKLENTIDFFKNNGKIAVKKPYAYVGDYICRGRRIGDYYG